MQVLKGLLLRSSWVLFQGTVFLSLVLALPSVAWAQGAAADSDPNPLRPADTSSPRDTLHSFLVNVDKVIVEWRRRDGLSVRGERAYFRAAETLDLSTTPHSDSWLVQSQRMLFLKEILDRIELPPYRDIPGVREVADGAIRRWTVPDTRITIARIEDGPRAGEFLFSADSVQRLDRFYRHIRHLPYKPEATAAGIYEDFLSSLNTDEAVEQEVRNQLKPVDTSNPRSTLLGFLDSVSRAQTLVIEADTAIAVSPPTMTKQQALEIETMADNLLRRASGTLDLSEVPEALRQGVGVEAVLQLKEIFDRMQLPHLDRVPDAQMVEAARQGVSGSFSPSAAPLRWMYPNTEIEIVEIIEGERRGEFLFSAKTVRRVSDFYEAIRNIPYRRGNPGTELGEYESIVKAEGFYDHYVSTPGYLIPRAHFLGGLLKVLPAWSLTPAGGQTLWQWIALFLCASAVAVAAYIVFRVFKRLAARVRPPLDDWLMVLVPFIVMAFVIAVRNFIDDDLNITGSTLSAVIAVTQTAVLILTAWVVWSVFNAIADTMIASPRIVESGLDASLLRIIAGLLGVIAGVWILLDGLQGLGADIVPLLAGLGVGGLAVALAVRPTLENLISGLILYFDKPVRVGDFCSFGDQMGTVENIGLRSTFIRALDQTVIAVPNAKFADMEIINWARCEQMLIDTTIGLRYETDTDQLRHVLVKIREMFHAHPKIDRDTVRVRFAGYGASSFDIRMRVYALTREWNEYHAIREDVFLRVNNIVKASGTRFALSSQTLYMGRDEALDEERSDAAIAEVKSWRRCGRLPFPRLSAAKMNQLEATLDYPPQGSVDAAITKPNEAKVPEPLSAETDPESSDEAKAQAQANPKPRSPE